jgi:hypothetical protein
MAKGFLVKLVHGWVEIRDDAGSWHSVLRINPLVSQTPEITSTLFGVDDHYVKKPIRPIANNRGFPNDVSDETRETHEAEKQWSHSETYIKPDEIAQVFEVKQLRKGWPLIFAFMGVLSEVYGDANVRLVVWFI